MAEHGGDEARQLVDVSLKACVSVPALAAGRFRDRHDASRRRRRARFAVLEVADHNREVGPANAPVPTDPPGRYALANGDSPELRVRDPDADAKGDGEGVRKIKIGLTHE